MSGRPEFTGTCIPEHFFVSFKPPRPGSANHYPSAPANWVAWVQNVFS